MKAAQSLSDQLMAAARCHARRPALSIFDGQTSTDHTYAELDDLSRRIAYWLVHNTKAGTYVLIFGDKSLACYATVLACIHAGRTFVPLSTNIPPARLEQIRQRLRPCVETPLTIGPIALSGPPASDNGNVAYVISTSGSTGEPKSIAVSYENLKAFLTNSSRLWSFSPEDRITQLFDFGFDPAIADIFWSFTTGACLCPTTSRQLPAISRYLETQGITVWGSSPSLLKVALDSGAITGESVFPRVRLSAFIGEKLTWDLLARWRHHVPASRFENHYGPAETTISVSRFQAVDPFANSSESVPLGEPHPGHRFEIITRDGERLEGGAEGELVIAGPQVALGYLDEAEKTKLKFRSFGWDESQKLWYRTGDRVRRSGDGNIYFVSRLDSQVKIRGVRVELAEIEWALNRVLPPGTLLGVFPWPEITSSSGTGTVALLSAPISSERIKSLRAQLSEYLTSAVLPSDYFYVEADNLAALLNDNGKLTREKVAAAMTTHKLKRCY